MPLRRSALVLYTLIIALLFCCVGGATSVGSLTTNVVEFIGARLWLFFIAIALLPALGMPNCPLMIVGGGAAATVHGSTTATIVAVLAVVTNILWSYWVAAYPLRSFLWQRIESGTRTRWLARMESSDVARATFLLHVTPGVPLFIQTYFPGLHRLAYWKYLAIAIPVQSLYTALIVFTSGEVFRWVPAPALAAIGFGSLAVILFASITRDAGWYQKQNDAA